MRSMRLLLSVNFLPSAVHANTQYSVTFSKCFLMVSCAVLIQG